MSTLARATLQPLSGVWRLKVAELDCKYRHHRNFLFVGSFDQCQARHSQEKEINEIIESECDRFFACDCTFAIEKTELLETIDNLLALGCPPLPVAPKQDPRKENCHHQTFVVQRFKPDPSKPYIQGNFCRISTTKVDGEIARVCGDYCRLDENLQPIARFTGKNPSYLDRTGKPRTIAHHQYQNRLPTEQEMATWFANPANGVGTLGGHAGVDWLDFDAKNYGSQEECDRDVAAVQSRVGASWVERTGSGGYRIAVRPQLHPTFTNFTTRLDGEGHIGEALWQGRFTVLAPSIHPNGKPYTRIDASEPAEVESLETIGIFPTKDELANQSRRAKREASGNKREPSDPTGNCWDIRNLAEYLDGYRIEGDYIKCRCPQHDGNSDNSLHIHVDTGGYRCWAECDLGGIYESALELAVARGHKTTGKRPKGSKSKPEVELPHYNLTYAPNVVSNSRYLGAIDVPSGEKLVLIRAPKGSGKTESIVALVKQAQLEGRRIWVITYREQLGQQLADRLGIGYRETIGGGLVLCIDSLHPNSEMHFSADRTQDDLVIIDEAESVAWHTLNSSTCAKSRQPILKEFRLLLQGVLSPESKGQVILADADLSDLSVDFTKGMADRRELKPYVIMNTYKPDRGYQAWSYSGAADLFASLEEAIADGGKHLILTSGQRVDSKWGSKNLEAALRSKFPEKRILRIDSSTITDPNQPAFGCISAINELLKAYDIVIASPTIESGVSIDLYGHFGGVWAFLSGVQAENSVRQFLMRLRDLDVTRHIFVAERGINNCFVGGGETEAKALLETEHRTARANLRAIHDAAMAGAIDADGSIAYNVAAQEAWGKLGARVNAGLARYRDAVLAGLRAEGHTVKDADTLTGDEAKNISEWMGEVRDGEHEIDCEARATATPIESEQEYEALKTEKVKTEAQRQSQARYELEQRYGVELTPELVKRDDGGWYASARMHYFLTIGREFLVERDRNRFKDISDDVGRAWLPDANQRLLAGKVEKLRSLGVDRLIAIAQTGERLYGTHPAIASVAAAARADAAEVKLLLKIDVTQSKADLSIAQDLLELATGERLEEVLNEQYKSQQRTIDGKRQHIYHLPEFKDGRSEIFTAWLKRDRDRVEQQQRQLEERAESAKSKLSHTTSVTTAHRSPYIDIRPTECSPLGVAEGAAAPVDEDSIADAIGMLATAVETGDRDIWQATKGVITELGSSFKQALWERLDRTLKEAVYRFEGATA